MAVVSPDFAIAGLGLEPIRFLLVTPDRPSASRALSYGGIRISTMSQYIFGGYPKHAAREYLQERKGFLV